MNCSSARQKTVFKKVQVLWQNSRRIQDMEFKPRESIHLLYTGCILQQHMILFEKFGT